jgi:hypothetical protein
MSIFEDVKPGEIYEDPFFHPCLCLGVNNGAVWGISLIDGSYPRTTDLGVSGVRKLSLQQAWENKLKGTERLAAEWDEMYPP